MRAGEQVQKLRVLQTKHASTSYSYAEAPETGLHSRAVVAVLKTERSAGETGTGAAREPSGSVVTAKSRVAPGTLAMDTRRALSWLGTAPVLHM
jgi:hypothetical protein